MKNKNAFYALIKAHADSYYVTTIDDFIDVVTDFKNEHKVITTFDSLVELIEDDYMRNSICMSELIRVYISEVDFEDISILLHYAGEEDQLEELVKELNENEDSKQDDIDDSELFAYVDIDGEKYYATTSNELAKILEDHAGKKKSIVQFGSIIELIKNDYYGNASMADTIKNKWINKITHDDIRNLLRFAGELDHVNELIKDDNTDTTKSIEKDTNTLKKMIEDCRYVVNYDIEQRYQNSKLRMDFSFVNAPKNHRDLMFQLATDVASNFMYCNGSGCITIPITYYSIGKLHKFLSAVK